MGGLVTEQQRSVQLQVLPATALRNSGDTELVNKVRIMSFMKSHHAHIYISKVGLVSLIFVSLLAVVLVLVMVTMLGLRRR